MRHPESSPQIRLVLDVMGGDYAPEVPLYGALEALPQLVEKSCALHLIGDSEKTRSLLQSRKLKPLQDAITQGGNVQFTHSEAVVEMHEAAHFVRRYPRASINLGCQAVAEDFRRGIKSSFISAGHSGAVLMSSLIHLGRIPGVDRPALATRIPSQSPNGCVILDVGANVDCKAHHLRDFAVMGAVYARVIQRHRGTALPRVGLLSNGEERCKGTETTRAALALIEELPCFKPGPQCIGEFVGYVEGKDLFSDQVDVAVVDGFVGNLLLKAAESLGTAVISTAEASVSQHWLSPVAIPAFRRVFRRLKRKLDYSEYGAAPLLGVAGSAFICHGQSNSRAIKNALLRAHAALEQNLTEQLEDQLTQVFGRTRMAGSDQNLGAH